MSEPNAAPLVELAVAPLVMRTITPQAARLIYQLQMPGIVARLYMYLFGEFDKDIVEHAVVQLAQTEPSVLNAILRKEHSPMRLIYDRLINLGLFEDQCLNSDAMLFIDLPDNLQLRIEVTSEDLPFASQDGQ